MTKTADDFLEELKEYLQKYLDTKELWLWKNPLKTSMAEELAETIIKKIEHFQAEANNENK